MDPLFDRARALDAADPLPTRREAFHVPKHEGVEQRYFCGNSLGLMPRSVREAIDIELDDWANLGVEAHFAGRNPWMPYHELLREPLARLVGAQPSEVVAMNSLTANLHLMMASFYRPAGSRRCWLVRIWRVITGPATSKNIVEEMVMVRSMLASSGNASPAASASPSATPACGISARPMARL